jgi:UDP-N-acetylmuramoylalanine--D-glutamate ligase
MEDHMNYYMQGGKSHEEATRLYFNDKAQIFLHQEQSGVFITTPEVFERAKQMGVGTIGQEVILADTSVLPEDMLLSMPGEHNRLNAALAYEALKATGLTDEEIFEGLASFPGVPGRLEYLGVRDGVAIYNDNNATTPAATIRGLEALAQEARPNATILIAGGASKDIELSALVGAMSRYCKRVILMPGTGTDVLVPQLERAHVLPVRIEGTTGDAVIQAALEDAIAHAVSGDIILFSPGFASFGLFKNEYDRNDVFVAAVAKYLSDTAD